MTKYEKMVFLLTSLLQDSILASSFKTDQTRCRGWRLDEVNQQYSAEFYCVPDAQGIKGYQPVGVNDISLEGGGVFDISAPRGSSYAWRPPHHWHSTGNSVDIRCQPNRNNSIIYVDEVIDRYLQLCRMKGLEFAIREDTPVPDDLAPKLKEKLRDFFRSRSQSAPLLTLGPKFRADANPRAIAADFHLGLSKLRRHGRLEADSPFVTACLDYLQSIIDEPAISRPGLAPDFEANPQTPLGQSLYRGLRLALDLSE